jgi:chromosome segregation ATPase
MITSHGENIFYSEQEKRRVQKVEDRLNNFVAEIDKHKKELSQIEATCIERANKSEELSQWITDFTRVKESLKSEIESLEIRKKKLNKELSESEERMKVIGDYLHKKENELKDREATLNQEESNHAQRISDFETESQKLESKKVLVAEAQRTLQDAIHKIQW